MFMSKDHDWERQQRVNEEREEAKMREDLEDADNQAFGEEHELNVLSGKLSKSLTQTWIDMLGDSLKGRSIPEQVAIMDNLCKNLDKLAKGGE